MPSIASLLKISYRLYKQHLSLLVGYTAWLLLPYLLLLGIELIPLPFDTLWLEWGLTVVVLAIAMWVSVVLVRAAFVITHGAKIDEPLLRKAAWKIVPPLLLVVLLKGIALTLGLFALIVPGLIFGVWFAFAELAVILDGMRGIKALKQSRDLVRGRFFQATWLTFGGPLLVFVVYAFFLALMIRFFGPDQALEALTPETVPLWLEIIDVTIQTFIFLPLFSIYFVFVYDWLKKTPAKEVNSK